MDEASRRSEILQAEEAVRLLAEELSRAKSASDAAEELRRKLEQAAATLGAAREALAEATRVHAAAGDATRTAVRTATEEARKALTASAESLRTALADVEAASKELKDATQQAVQRTGHLVQSLDGRLREIASSISDVKLSLAGGLVAPADIEARLSEIIASTVVLSGAMAELRQEMRNIPGEIITQLRRSLRKQKAVVAAGVVLCAGTFVAACLILWIVASQAAK